MENDGQVTITEAQQSYSLNGLIVKDAVLLIQLIERLVKTGTLQGSELYPLGVLRERVVKAIQESVTVDDEKTTSQKEEETV